MQVDLANVPLPTPSTTSTHTPDQPMRPPSPPTFRVSTSGLSQYHTLPIVDHLISLGMQAILGFLQPGATSEHERERPHHSASTSDMHDLHHALADMFGLPPLPIPQPAPDRSPSSMAATSKSQSCCNESCQSPAKSTVPATWEHSPDPEEAHKQPNIWDLKDPAHPLHQHGTQKAYEHWLDKAREKANNSPKCPSPSTDPHLPGLEEIPEEESPLEEHPPIAGPSTMPGGF
jgi:hypothetical protein